MSAASFDRLLSNTSLAQRESAGHSLSADRSIRLVRSLEDKIEGKFSPRGRKAIAGQGPATLSSLAARRGAMLRHAASAPKRESYGDAGAGQRAVVKIHYFDHAGGGGGALRAHARYLAREAPARGGDEEPGPSARAPGEDSEQPDRDAELLAAPAAPFYDRDAEGVDGHARAADWARADRRHFRIILAPENADTLADLPAYVREVMARAEASLGTRLQWVAVDHHDTGHAHSHLILRGRRANGQDLFLPKDFIRHGMRAIAREVATEWLGPRTPQQAREALENDITRHAPTSLDRMIARQLDEENRVRINKLEAPDGDPALRKALRARAVELQRLGLASGERGGVLAFVGDWQARLAAMERHLDIRKSLMQARSAERDRLMKRAVSRSLSDWFGR